MEWIIELTKQLTGVMIEGGEEFVTIALTEGAKFIWKEIKRFFKGNKAIPLEVREEVSTIDAGDTLPAEKLKEILNCLPKDLVEKLVNEKSTIQNHVACANNNSTVTIWGDVAGRDIIKD